MGQLKDFFAKTRTKWGELSKSKRMSIIILLGSLLIAVLVFTLTLGKTEYVPVFTNLSMQDSAQIIESLEDQKFNNYRLADGGASILVPADNVDKLRIDLAMDGTLPNSGTGYELFDDTDYSMTDADRKIMYQRALQGELERSIQSLEEVERARVHLVLTEDSIFVREKEPSTGSIILTLKAGQTLEPRQILGIISLVSGAVKDLPEENIRVVDSRANLLSQGIAGINNDPWGQQNTGQRMDIEREFELGLKEDLRQMLEMVFGAGRVLVNVNADLDFDSEESTTITYNPQGVIRSEQTRINRNEGSYVGEGEGGSPIDDNTQNVIEEDEDYVNTGGYSRESIINYEIGEMTTYSKKAPGTIKRVSTSVVYDGDLSDERKQSMLNIVMAATGFDETRGDLINVEGVAFDTSIQKEIEDLIAREEAARIADQESQAALRRSFLLYGSIGLAGAVLLIFILMLALRTRDRNRASADEVGSLFATTIDEPLPIDELLKQAAQEEASEDSLIERDIREFAQENPEQMTELIRAWILEDER
ncbi:MAG TPA: flagellar basal-body MS-ring/collar protein FliF [Bacillota bacterium]|nr:flagellar basal-body MS-ring/collar protein FliF [Bacillota bacterium]